MGGRREGNEKNYCCQLAADPGFQHLCNGFCDESEGDLYKSGERPVGGIRGSDYGADFFRSSFTMHISNDYGAEKKIGEYNFSSKYRKDFSMETYRHPDIIKRTAYPMRYRITLRTYYKTTYMGFYTWKKCHTTKTYFWVY